ncbi:MAG: AzlC family ABC transporter permease [Erysipelotrichaceae bacterium]|nr:AzlC family ABC transporter permease [Erysipelotrichaceae bacterium]
MVKSIKTAIVLTFPIFLGYVFLGIAFGLLLNKAGYGLLEAIVSSTFIYAGSAQFAMISFLKENTQLFSILIMTFLINSRQMFYGISLINKYQEMGKLKPYMMFSLTDETYALIIGLNDTLDKKTLFCISLLNHLYWILGSILGVVAGNFIKFNSTGIDFAMTALFVVIMVEQAENNDDKFPLYIGLICGILCLLIFKANNFILPSILFSSIILYWRNKK